MAEQGHSFGQRNQTWRSRLISSSGKWGIMVTRWVTDVFSVHWWILTGHVSFNWPVTSNRSAGMHFLPRTFQTGRKLAQLGSVQFWPVRRGNSSCSNTEHRSAHFPLCFSHMIRANTRREGGRWWTEARQSETRISSWFHQPFVGQVGWPFLMSPPNMPASHTCIQASF